MQLSKQPSFFRLVGQQVAKDGQILIQNNPCIVVSSERKYSFPFQQKAYQNGILQNLSEQINFSDSFIYEKHFHSVFGNYPAFLTNSHEEKNINSFVEYGLFVKRLIRSYESKNLISQMLFLTQLLKVVEEGIKKEQKVI
jgi:hypothetical protein